MSVLKIGNRSFELGKKTVIAGILNVTPDSFSDGGEFFSVKNAVDRAIQMQKDGADIIDIGSESTRPSSNPISLDEELKRVIPVVEELVKKINIPISIDTYKSEIAKKTLDIGVDMINDITALQGDKNLANIIVEYDVPVCLMHMKGTPGDMQRNPQYDDVVKEIHDFLKKRTKLEMKFVPVLFRNEF